MTRRMPLLVETLIDSPDWDGHDLAGLAARAGDATLTALGLDPAGFAISLMGCDDDRIAVVIADVADKGMPAALYMAQTRSLILAVARHSQAPAAVLRDVNRLLLEVGEANMFVTVFYGVLDTRRGRLTYSRAGHDHPFLVRGGGLEPLGGRGMALGLFAGDIFHLSEETVEVRPGDRLVLYTDGLTDVVGPDDEMLGYDRWVEAVLRRSSLPPAEMCRALFDDLTAYRQGAAQFDDMALVVVGID